MPTPELYALLDEHLDTFEKLELVLALRSAGTEMSLPDLAVQLQVGPEVLRRVASQVVTTGIIESTSEDVFRARSHAWEREIEEAAHIFATDPTKLMRAFTRIAMGRIRGMAARTFADAFRVRKKGD